MLKQRVEPADKVINSTSEIDFEAIFKKYFPALRKYAQLFVQEQAAEDIVQDILIYLWEQRENLRIHTSTEAYLFRSVYQRCLSQIKQKNIHSRHLSQIEIDLRQAELSYFDSDQNEVIRTLFMNDLSHDLNNAIESLPARCREVFELSFLQDYQNKQISEKLNISVNTVESHITNALKTLRRKLSKLMSVFV
ncbi:MAG: RNA polymerase sigma-70 factor [Mariniphaga sp.]